MKAQISAEMILLMVVLLAVVAIVASNLLQSTEKASQAVESSSSKVIEGVSDICVKDEQCASGQCVNGICKQ